MNQAKFEKDLKNNTNVVICDNTNLQPWQTAPYTTLARKYGFRILFLNFLPRELWKHVQSQKVTPEKPDAHEVPECRLIEFIDDFNNYNDLLNRSSVIHPAIQHDFVWDNETLCPKMTGRPAVHFDSDQVITIVPAEYHQLKSEIGIKILNFIHE